MRLYRHHQRCLPRLRPARDRRRTQVPAHSPDYRLPSGHPGPLQRRQTPRGGRKSQAWLRWYLCLSGLGLLGLSRLLPMWRPAGHHPLRGRTLRPGRPFRPPRRPSQKFRRRRHLLHRLCLGTTKSLGRNSGGYRPPAPGGRSSNRRPLYFGPADVDPPLPGQP